LRIRHDFDGAYRANAYSIPLAGAYVFFDSFGNTPAPSD